VQDARAVDPLGRARWLDDYDAAVREVALDRREIGKQRLRFQALGNYRRERIVDQEPHLEAASGSSRSRTASAA
jgi:hypothetical protein